MRVTITDKEALRVLSWNAVATYLNAAGWQQIEDVPGTSVAYQLTDEEGRLWEVLVLLRDDLADYVSRMGDAVSTLARVEDRSELEVYGDLAALDARASVHKPGIYSNGETGDNTIVAWRDDADVDQKPRPPRDRLPRRHAP